MTKEDLPLTARERKIAITFLICLLGSFGLIRVIFDEGSRWHIVNAPKNLNWHISRLNLNPFQQDPKKIEVSLLDPKNQDNEALYYRSLMGIIETQIDLRDSAYQFSVPIDESMTRDICSSKYSVLEGLKGNGLPLGPEMNEKLNRLTTNMQC